jgi:hypothetical protein
MRLLFVMKMENGLIKASKIEKTFYNLRKATIFAQNNKTMVTYSIFDELANLMVSVPKPEQIISFQPSAELQSRLEDLLDKKREEGLTEAEHYELEQFILVEHLMRLVKFRARQRLALA